MCDFKRLAVVNAVSELLLLHLNLFLLNLFDLLQVLHLLLKLSNFDLLLSLSDHEGFSRVVVEALYVGLFVIAFENNGTKFIKDFDNSSLLKSKDIGLLKKEIYKFLNSNKSISTENRKNIEKKYSTKNIASKFDEIYNDNVDG